MMGIRHLAVVGASLGPALAAPAKGSAPKPAKP
jgi:hypothetical protein